MDFSQAWIAVFGVGAVLLVNQHSPFVRRFGPILGLVSQPAWFYTTFQHEQWGILVLSTIYTYSWGLGVYNGWFRKRRTNQ